MATEETQAPEAEAPDTPAPETPDSQTGTPDAEVNWEKRYHDIQPALTQSQQEAAELRQYKEAVEALHSDDPQQVQWAAEVLRLELSEDETPETLEAEEGDPELEAIKQAYRDNQQAQEAQQQTEYHAGVAIQALNEALKPEGREMGDGKDPIDRLLFNEAFSLVRDGTHPAEAAQTAMELVNEVVKQAGPQAWAKTKNVSTPALGREAVEEALPLDAKHGDRVADMVSKLEANQ